MAMSTSKYWGGVHKEAKLRLGEGVELVAKCVLLDTGAIDEDYISSAFIKYHYKELEKFIVRERTVIKLADDSTVVELPGYVDAQVVFTDHLGVDHVGGSRLRILKGGAKDMIIGLNSLCSKFFEFFVESLRGVSEDQQQSESAVNSVEKIVIHEAGSPFIPPEGVDPKKVLYRSDTLPGTEVEFSFGDTTEAPEEALIPDPCSFTDSLSYMEKSVEESETEYLRDMPSIVSKEFAESTDVLNLLRTKGLRVFVPNNWEGIRDLVVDLSFREDMPKRMKPRARPTVRTT